MKSSFSVRKNCLYPHKSGIVIAKCGSARRNITIILISIVSGFKNLKNVKSCEAEIKNRKKNIATENKLKNGLEITGKNFIFYSNSNRRGFIFNLLI